MRCIPFLIIFILFGGNVFSQSISFTENRGQISDQHFNPRPDVLFSGESGEIDFHLRKDGVTYQLISTEKHGDRDKTFIYNRTDITWKNCNPDPEILPKKKLEYYSNYYLSTCPEGALKVPSYGEIQYKNIYDGIDIRWYEKESQLEYDFIVHPGSDYQDIQLKIEGGEAFIDRQGNLVMKNTLGTIIESSPIAFQNDKEVKAKWVQNASGDFMFQIKKWDPENMLVIDPVVRVWGTYFGGSSDEFGTGICTDDSNFVYITGGTRNANLVATTGSHQDTISGGVSTYYDDAFVAKFSSSGDRIWGTYYGGWSQDYGQSVHIDRKGNVYISGDTRSINVIATPGSHQDSLVGGGTGIGDIFLAKFNSQGVRLWATYYGSFGDEEGIDICTDKSNNVYLAGSTNSMLSFTTPLSHQQFHSGPSFMGFNYATQRDVFIAKFSENGIRIWGTYFGGKSNDYLHTILTDDSNNIYISGNTSSDSSIATPNSYRDTFRSWRDVYLAKFDSNGLQLYGTYYGGDGGDFGGFCGLDDQSNIYLIGETNDSSDIATQNSYQDTISQTDNGVNLFIVKFSPNFTRQWATYHPGRNVTGAKINKEAILISAHSNSTSDIATKGSHQYSPPGLNDPVIIKFDTTGAKIWGTYNGGPQNEYQGRITSDKQQNVYVTGYTWSKTIMATPNSHQPTFSGFEAVYISKFKSCESDTSRSTENVCQGMLSPSGKYYWEESGMQSDTLKNESGCDSVIFVDLTVRKINTSVTLSGHTYTSQATGATYQWINCDNDSLIPGETSKTFTATKNGNYAVILNKIACTDTSECLEINWVSINEYDQTQRVNLMPNPAHENVVVTILGEERIERIVVFNSTGQEVLNRSRVNQSSTEINVSSLERGFYQLLIETKESVYKEKLVID